MQNDDGLGEAMMRDSAARAHEEPLAELRQRLEEAIALVLNHEKRLRVLRKHGGITNDRLEALEACMERVMPTLN